MRRYCFAWEFNSHHWASPSSLPHHPQLLLSLCFLPSAFCRCTSPKIIYVGVTVAALKRGQHNWAFRKCRVGGTRVWQKPSKLFRVPSTVCPFSACLSPAGHEMAAKKTRSRSRRSRRRRSAPRNSLTIGQVERQSANNMLPTTSHVLIVWLPGCCPCHRLLEPLSMSLSLSLPPIA